MINRFSPQDLQGAQVLLNELLAQVSNEESTLAAGTKLGVGSEALQSLCQTKITFGNPTNDLVRLTKKLFDGVGVELTEIRKRQIAEQFNFYYMTLTVSMRPKRGALFTQMECSLDFGPKGVDEPIIQTIFPKSEWREVLNWGGQLHLALNGNLEWGVGIDPSDINKIINIPNHLKAKVANQDQLKARIVVPNYSFKLGRAEIVATGEGNSNCFWRIETPDLQEVQTVQFGIVFKVPKDVTSIEVTGLVAAEPSINWLVANVRNVFDDLSDKLQNLLRPNAERQGQELLPIGDHEKWTLNLPQ